MTTRSIRSESVQLVDCPRDAMQGWPTLISTQRKIAYLQQLIRVGFPVLDMGSFVSPKAVPQMADTATVVDALELGLSKTELLVIVANERGADEALIHQKLSWLGYPFSISETFQQRNTGTNLTDSLSVVSSLQEKVDQKNRKLIVYLSMAFGNPYGDKYAPDIVLEWADRLIQQGVTHFSLADTVGLATPTQVYDLTQAFNKEFPAITASLHLHAARNAWEEKLEAGLKAGCLKFDGAIGGIGGCPFAGSELVGNMNTIDMANWLATHHMNTQLDLEQLKICGLLAEEIFS